MASSTEKKLAALARALLAKTEAGELEWRETDKEGAFIHVGSTATISMEVNEGDYVMSLLNPSGTRLDSISSTFYDDYGNEHDEEWAVTLRQLHDAARRAALDIDSAIDGLLKEIGGSLPPSYLDYGEEPF